MPMTTTEQGAAPAPRAEWTMDDVHFGVTTNGNRTVTTPLVKRPAGLSRQEWYKFGGELKQALSPMTPNDAIISYDKLKDV